MNQSPRDRRLEVEVFLLAALLQRPTVHPWPIAGLRPQSFSRPDLRALCEIACSLRDKGRAPHWRRVRMVASARSQALADCVTALHTIASAPSFGSPAEIEWWSGELRRLTRNGVLAAWKGFGKDGWEANSPVKLPSFPMGATTAHGAPTETKAAIVRDLAVYAALMPRGVEREAFEARIAQRVGVSVEAVRHEIRRLN
jgi:DnaB-helicase binding domain of primase